MFPALFRTDRKLDVAISQDDMERVSVARLQIGGVHVELPMATALGETSTRDIGSSMFVHVINRAPPNACQCYPAATAAGKDHIRVGDSVAIGVSHLELHRDRAAGLALVNARAICIDRRQNNATRFRSSAGAIGHS